MPKKINWRYVFIAIITVATPIAMITLKSHSSATAPSPTIPVKTVSAKEADKNIPLEISGFVRGENRADVAPMSSGQILRIFKHEGEEVKKGEIIAAIESNVSDAQIAAASGNIEALKKTLDDSEEYYDQLVDQAKDSDASDEAVKSAKKGRNLQIQTVQNQLVSAEGSLKIAHEGKNNYIVTAPFAGIISSIYGREGGFANFSTPLVSISTKNNLEIETYVSAENGRNIAVGNLAILNSSDGQPISGIVTTVAPGSDSMSFKTLVRIHLNDETGSVHLGDFLHGRIMVPNLKQNTISIPKKAVVSRGGDQVVFILDENNIAKEKQIEISTEQNGFVSVIEGLSIDQKIITEGQQYIINGSKTSPYESN